MSFPLRAFALALTALLLLGSGVQALRLVGGHLLADAGASWASAPPETGGAAWLASARLESAIRVSGGDPRHLERLAILRTERADRLRTIAPQYSGALQDEADELLLRAEAARPTWYSPGLRRLWLRWSRFRIDDEFNRLVERSMSLGPFEPGVLNVVVETVASTWFLVEPPTRELAREAARRGLRQPTERHRAASQQLLDRIGAWWLVCDDPEVIAAWPDRCPNPADPG